MFETVNVTKTLDAPVDKVWAAIREIGGLDRWFPIISACRVEGAGVGAVRVMTLANGAEMRDRITEIDVDAKRLCYERTHLPFPVRDYRGRVEIREDRASRTILSWTTQFLVAGDDREEMLSLVKTAISDGVDGLERDLR